MEAMNEKSQSEKVAELVESIKVAFPDAVRVQVDVSGEGYSVEPTYAKTEFNSIRTLSGELA
jgi:hypothetical protein